ncbi:ABC transporter permease [Tenacibaculum agarivorans]|uniref:ABC transporter permease n=1 Tax=Tenacibaculum agarivorans TaxID=1908389 RepID=UPI00094B9A4A|nr:ABC transporter permease [Tenacibaculum agarivorans]
MNVWKMSLENIKSKPLYTFISVFTLTLSIALLLGIQQLKSSFKYQTENNLGEIDVVVGAKGSPLQLVLASVLHLDDPTGNISYKEAKKIAKNPMIGSAVPISYGDNYKGYRIVGTSDQFTSLYGGELATGKKINKSLEAIIGSTVANKLNLSVGDTFLSSHGLIENEIDVHEEVFTVVGILKPTYKVIDRLIITKLESIWDVHDHHDHENEEHDKNEEHSDEYKNHEEHKDHDDHEEHSDEHKNHEEHKDHDDHEEHSDEHKNHTEHKDHDDDEEHSDEHEEDQEITSLLISFKNPRGILTLPRKINQQTNMQAALPKFEMDKLYAYTGIGFKTITWIAYLILFIAGLTIFISLYKMVKDRAFDLALLRTYGASNAQLIKMVTYEGFIIVFTAFGLGVIVIKIILKLLLNTFKVGHQQSMLQGLSFTDTYPIALLVLILAIISISLSVYPILKMKISTILSNEK